MVELGEIVEEAQGTDYPNLLFRTRTSPRRSARKGL